MGGKKRLTLEFVKEKFELDGYQLTSKEYINCKQKLGYICPKGHRHSILWGGWQRGSRCPYCDGQGKPDICVIKEFFEKYGYKLLSTAYVNDSHKLSYICPEGHRHSMRWGNFRHGKRCPECSKVRQVLQITGKNHYNWKGGITPFNKELRNFVKHIGWTDDVFKRDNYTCQKCKNRGGSLAAHHIISLSEIKDRFNINNIEDAQQCDMIYDIDNGMTLCKTCHKSIHDNLRGGIRFMSEDRVNGVVKWFA